MVAPLVAHPEATTTSGPTRVQVVDAWRCFLGRYPSPDLLDGCLGLESVDALVETLANSEEFGRRVELGYATVIGAYGAFATLHGPTAGSPPEYFVPTSLRRSPSGLRRVLLVGACVFDAFVDPIRAVGDVEVDHLLFTGYASPFDQLERPLADYDLMLVQTPLRTIAPEDETMGLGIGDVAGHEAALERAFERLRFELDLTLAIPGRPTTLVLNLPTPQRAMLGRVLPRFDVRDPGHFIERLNQRLAELLPDYPDAHLFDLDQLSGAFGRRAVQDDAFWSVAHGGWITDYDFPLDADRLEPVEPLSALHRFDVDTFVRVAWSEAEAMYRTLRGIDAVKMICVDLDDTLWRGVLAERDDVDGSLIEGWPLGFAEALTICRKRGIILAIVSKNDSARIAELWPQVFGRRLSLDDFAIRKIGWGPKPDALADAIAEANVLPDSVVFIDDNPVERAAVAAALPEVRLLGAPHYDWRRTLLWSAETQVASITAESSRLTEMIRTQGVRESRRAASSREDFLGELGLAIELSPVVATTAPRFERAIELINKTNQFNTTGRRWTQAEAAGHFARGGVWWTFSASDIYTNYGLIGVIVQSGDTLDQFVMSCRVFGLGIEQAALHGVAQRALEDHASLSAEIVETPKNGPARGVFRDAGWRQEGTTWIGERVGEPPAHIRLSAHALA